LDGVLVVAKPAGPTSHDVVALVRRLSGTRRIGHGGTLDPFASGVLPLFLGVATRLVEYHLADTKSYRATVCFGASSSTDDLEGELVPVEGQPIVRAAVEAALAGFRGEIEQRPPAYSAVKVAGRRAYALARAGTAVELAPRRVRIDRLAIASWDETDPARPVAVLEVTCSAGTYVRSLARDLGATVGSGAYLGALVRTASGPFGLADAVPLDDVRAAAASGAESIRAMLRPPDAGLDAMPEATLAADDVVAVSRGQFVRPRPFQPLDEGVPIRLRDEGGRLVAIGVVRGGRVAPDKVLVTPPESSSRRLDLAAATEADPPYGVDPDPASPDNV
jgi:tRNA pseudouridine55 synthase